MSNMSSGYVVVITVRMPALIICGMIGAKEKF